MDAGVDRPVFSTEIAACDQSFALLHNQSSGSSAAEILREVEVGALAVEPIGYAIAGLGRLDLVIECPGAMVLAEHLVVGGINSAEQPVG